MGSFTGASYFTPGNTQNLTASFQADALGGMGGGDDMSGILEQLLARKKKQDLQAKNKAGRAPKQDMRGGPPPMSVGQRRVLANAAIPEQTAPQRAISSVGGLASTGYRDTMRQMMANTAMGMPQTEYTGWTDLVKALQAGGGGQAAEQAAGRQRLRNAGMQLQAVEQG